MKKLMLRVALFAAAAVVLAAPAARAQVDVDVNVSIGGFYDELAPYGQWVDCSYGQCWVPARVAVGWQPYSNGQWIYTQYGWTWVSSDPWGGSPYHYGTWTLIAGYGWSWVPGTVWAPAWVTWSYSNNYVGWAPVPPSIVFGAAGYSGSPIVVRETQYVFVPTNRFVGGNVMTVRVPAQQSAAIFRQTRPVTGFAVSGGIVRNTALPMATIERASGRTIETKSIQAARTAPRAVAAGPAQWSVVAPAREVKAAVAARPQTATARNAPVDHGTGSVPKAPDAQKERKAPDASPIEAHRPPAEAPAAHRPEPPHQAEAGRPAESAAKPAQKPKHQPGEEKPDAQAHRSPAEQPAARPEASAKPKPQTHVEKSVGESHPAPAEAPVAHRPPPRPAEPAQKPKANPPKPKPDDKDQKPDGAKP